MIVHLNGRLMPAEDARVSPFDRGFLFGDGVYEGLRAFDGELRAPHAHVERFRDGLRASALEFDAEVLPDMCHELMDANGLRNAFVYWQVTRGTPGPGEPMRSRLPLGKLEPTVFGFAYETPPLEHYRTPPTCRLQRVPDERWHRGEIKSVSLHGNILAALAAREHGQVEALMIRGGLVTEGSAANVLLAIPGADSESRLVTPCLESTSILAGVTRKVLLEVDPTIEERPVLADELAAASEIMLVGTSAMVTSAVELDGAPVGGGVPGPEAKRLAERLVAAALAERAAHALA